MASELSLLTSSELGSLDRDRTVFLYPVGAFEDHGPHLPLGLDLLEADALTRKLADRIETEMKGWTCVRMPAAPLGVEGNTTRLAITVRPHVLRDWLVDSARALGRNGFRNFVCVSGHLGPRQLSSIEEAGRLLYGPLKMLSLSRKPLLLSASSALTTAQDVKRSPFWPDAEEHGGSRDTSMALAIEPKAVRPSHATLPAQDRDPAFFTRGLERFKGARAGYWGDPSKGDAAAGEALLAQAVDRIFSRLRPVLEGAPPRSLFRSWYSVLPPNRSFFKAWVLAFLTLIIMVGWVFLTLRGLGT